MTLFSLKSSRSLESIFQNYTNQLKLILVFEEGSKGLSLQAWITMHLKGAPAGIITISCLANCVFNQPKIEQLKLYTLIKLPALRKGVDGGIPGICIHVTNFSESSRPTIDISYPGK